mmetsp:Transcript_3194/g.7497  ORF Transcript_3194/g.7497 Transcript_3194/m.7497 type:complete len:279 (+) Transcript_3194:608-1444(+)
MIVDAVQCARRRRWHPSGTGSSHNLGNLGIDHRPHAVWLRPHALANLALARKAGKESHIHVGILVGSDPCLALHIGLRHHRTCHHARVDLVARSVQEAGVDEKSPLCSHSETLTEVDTRAPLLVHDPHLDGIPPETHDLLHTAEESARECYLTRPVHLRLHNVQRAGPAVAALARTTKVLKGRGGRDETVEETLGDHLTSLSHHCISEHVVAHIPHQCNAPPWKRAGLALGVPEPDVGAHGPLHRNSILHIGCSQCTPEDSVDVRVDSSLIFGIHCRD